MRVLLCLCLSLAACKSHEVRCDARLQPINLPAPAVQPLSPPAPETR